MDTKEQEISNAQRIISEQDIPFQIRTGTPFIDETMSLDFVYPDSDLREYEYLEERKNRYGRIQFMTPDRYLKECQYGFALRGRYLPMNEIIRVRDERDISRYADMMKKGVKFKAPYLHYDKRYDPPYFSQEGIHRALAYQRIRPNGLMPVIIVEEYP